jgi:hypothetical protein
LLKSNVSRRRGGPCARAMAVISRTLNSLPNAYLCGLPSPHFAPSRRFTMPLGYLRSCCAHLPNPIPSSTIFLKRLARDMETYVPLEVFEGLERDGVDWRLTMSITPTLALLSDPLLQYRCTCGIDNLIAWQAGTERTRGSQVPSSGRDVRTASRCTRHVCEAIRSQSAERLPPLLRCRQVG